MSTISIGEAMAGGFRAIAMPQRGLSEVRAEMSRRNENRMMILRSLSHSTSQASRSMSANSSNSSSRSS